MRASSGRPLATVDCGKFGFRTARMDQQVSSDPVPVAPTFPGWAKVSGFIAFAVYAAGFSLVDLSRLQAFMLATPAVAAFLVGYWRNRRNEGRHEIASLEWQLRSARRSIESHEAELAEGQPFYDDDDPSEWEFKRKHWIANARDRILAIEGKLAILRPD